MLLGVLHVTFRAYVPRHAASQIFSLTVAAVPPPSHHSTRRAKKKKSLGW